MIDLRCGDCLTILPTLADASVDAVVTDPPGAIGFMNKAWDHNRGGRAAWVAWLASVMRECLRVAKPGSRLLCWALPRTSHWTGTAIEDAGWVVEERISHIFGQGFPKAKSKLKPAVEDWWMARKPGRGVPELNIDKCRIGIEKGDSIYAKNPHTQGTIGANGIYGEGKPTLYEVPAGRWPANLTISHHPDCREVGTRRVKSNGRPNCEGKVYGADRLAYSNGTSAHHAVGDPDGLETVAEWRCVEGCPVRLLDEQSGDKAGAHGRGDRVYDRRVLLGEMKGDHGAIARDSGGASRFFYCPKASRADRGADNRHPTVKPVALMRWLCRLITPPGGLILDPFVGSGTTLLAADMEGFDAIGIEADADYVAMAEGRLRDDRTPLFSGIAL